MIATTAYGLYRFFASDYLDDFEDEFEDDFFDEDDDVEEQEVLLVRKCIGE